MVNNYCDIQENCKMVAQLTAQYEKVVEQNKSLQSELRGDKVGTYNIGHGFTLKGEYYEEKGKNYYILDIYQNGKLVHFGEVKLEDKEKCQ